MRIAGVHATSLMDGKGINYTLFVQGCDHKCEGCHNPSTWSFTGGKEISLEKIEKHILSYVPPVSGVTFSGGDPMYQIKETIELAEWAKAHGLQTTLYTGFDVSEVCKAMSGKDYPFDYIIDGCFEMEKKSVDTAFRGSSNQKIWKLVKGTYSSVEVDEKGKEHV